MNRNIMREQLIQKAYGNVWGKVSKYVELEGGWCQFIWIEGEYCIYPEKLGFSEKQIEKETFRGIPRWRPKTISGIEVNNEWIPIRVIFETPLQEMEVHAYCDGEYYGVLSLTDLRILAEKREGGETFTHWMPVRVPKPPFY